MEELKKYRLGEIADVLDYKRIPLSQSQRSLLSKIYPYYGAQGIIDYVDNYIFDGKYILIAEDGNNLKSLNEPIALIAEGKFWVNNHAHIITNKAGVDFQFLYYKIINTDIQGYITGSAQPKLNQENLLNIELSLPSLATQKRISSVLSHIDRLISTKRHENSTLEAMAKEIYDYWFVQFDFPNNDGKPYKSSGGKMVFNEILKREIPEGWEVKRLFDVAEMNANNISVNESVKDILYLDTANIINNTVGQLQYMDLNDAPSRAKRKVKNNTIVFSTVRPKLKHYGILKNPSNSLIVSTGFTTIDVDETIINPDIVYYWLTQENIVNNLQTIAENSVSAYPSINPSDLEALYLAIPSFKDNPLSCLNLRIKSNQDIIQNLTSLRDYLLPLLMNGQVEVKEAEPKFQEMYSEMAMAAEEGCKFGE